MKKLDDILALADDPIEVTPPNAKHPVRLRWPSFSEWHALAVAHRKLDGEEPTAELIARTVATCLANEDGERRYGDADIDVLLQGNSRTLMWLYMTCWQTVLKNDEEAVKRDEGK